jgi:hypothetical protein
MFRSTPSLPKPGRVHEVVSHPALSYEKIGAFMAKLRQDPGVGARALEFTILTAVHSGETLGRLVVRNGPRETPSDHPEGRMKMRDRRGRDDHTVPLSDAVVAILEALPKGEPGDLVFPGRPNAHRITQKPLGESTFRRIALRIRHRLAT